MKGFGLASILLSASLFGCIPSANSFNEIPEPKCESEIRYQGDSTVTNYLNSLSEECRNSYGK